MSLKEEINKKIDTLLSELKRCKSKDLRFKIVNALVAIKEIVDKANLNITIPDVFDFEISSTDFSSIYKKINDEFQINYDNMYEYNYKLMNRLNMLTIKYPNKYFTLTTSVSSDEAIKMALTFYKFYNNNIYNYLYDLLQSNYLIISNKVDNGITTSSNEYIEPYSIINLDGSVKDIMTIIHETIHNYMFNLTRNKNINDSIRSITNNLQEVYPTFLELVACDYFKSIGYNINDIKEYERMKDASLINMINRYYITLLNGNNCEYDEYRINEAYSYGGILAYHYFDKYQKNRMEAKVDIINFSLEEKRFDKSFMLDKFGISKKRMLDKSVIDYYMSKHNK